MSTANTSSSRHSTTRTSTCPTWDDEVKHSWCSWLYGANRTSAGGLQSSNRTPRNASTGSAVKLAATPTTRSAADLSRSLDRGDAILGGRSRHRGRSRRHQERAGPVRRPRPRGRGSWRGALGGPLLVRGAAGGADEQASVALTAAAGARRPGRGGGLVRSSAATRTASPSASASAASTQRPDRQMSVMLRTNDRRQGRPGRAPGPASSPRPPTARRNCRRSGRRPVPAGIPPRPRRPHDPLGR